MEFPLYFADYLIFPIQLFDKHIKIMYRMTLAISNFEQWRINMKKEVNSIDLFKLFFAIGIVGIHSGVIRVIPSPVDYYVMKLWFRVGVPYFFIASGYFFGKKLDSSSLETNFKNTFSFCTRMLIPLFTWGGLKVFKTIIEDIRQGDWESKVIIDIHRSIFYPPAGMWYVLAMIISVIVITLLYKHEIIMIILAVIGYSFALLCNSYYFMIEGTSFQILVDSYMEYFISARNGLFVGFIFCGFRVFLARREKTGLPISPATGYIILILSLICYVFEIVKLFGKSYADDNSLFITSLLISGSLFIVSKNMHMPYSITTSIIMRDLSKYIFFTHTFVMSYLSIVLLHITRNELIFFIHTLVICTLIYLISRKLNFKFLNKIIP